MSDAWVRLRTVASRFLWAVRSLARSEVGGRAGALFGLLVVFLCTINGLNVLASYVGRDFMTAIAERRASEIAYRTALYVAVFAGLTCVAAVHRYTEDRLGLLWRGWLTRSSIGSYLEGHAYYQLEAAAGIENPDQRIAEDARAFTATTLSFVLIWLNGTFTIVAFSSVLWDISPPLFGLAVGYAAAGTAVTVALGRPLLQLNCRQLDLEGALRADLIHVRSHAESVALLAREAALARRLFQRLADLVGNSRRIFSVNRNLALFTGGYNYLIQVLPALVVAPLYFRGEAAFGVIPQAAMAFSMLLGAFSVIVTQFQSISSFAAVVSRLNALADGIEHAHAPHATGPRVLDEPGRLAYEGLTLTDPHDGRLLVRDLGVTIPARARVLVVGPDHSTAALMRATAGLWSSGHGTIVRPPPDAICFVPERPYSPPAPLAAVLGCTTVRAVDADEIATVLRALELEEVVARAGGLDAEREWGEWLTIEEQQRLAIVRVLIARPTFVFLEQIQRALDERTLARVLALLDARGIAAVVTADHRASHDEGRWDAVLGVAADGRTTWTEGRRACTEPS